MQVRFCHMDTWVADFFFEEEWQASQQHGQDPLNWTFVCGGGSWHSTINHGAEAGKIKDLLRFVENGVQGGITLEGTERVIWVHLVRALVFTLTLVSTHTLPSTTHLCTFVHSSCEVPFSGMGAQLQQEDCYDFDKVTEKIFPNWKKKKTREVRLLSPPVYIHIFVLPFRVERKFTNGWRKIHETLIIWSECSSRKPIFLKNRFETDSWVSQLFASNPEITGDGRENHMDWGAGRAAVSPRLTDIY